MGMRTVILFGSFLGCATTATGSMPAAADSAGAAIAGGVSATFSTATDGFAPATGAGAPAQDAKKATSAAMYENFFMMEFLLEGFKEYDQ
ncbi:MAG: hypothetical protein A2Z99_17915 [Treponema sp. GWB1_62_6]|nr:MAG: hypothetical protein A2Z99_17915 [Treponema sp. GWB1_62_6]